VRRADNLTTFMCLLSGNLGTSASWNPLRLSRPVMGLLLQYHQSLKYPKCYTSVVESSPRLLSPREKDQYCAVYSTPTLPERKFFVLSSASPIYPKENVSVIV